MMLTNLSKKEDKINQTQVLSKKDKINLIDE